MGILHCLKSQDMLHGLSVVDLLEAAAAEQTSVAPIQGICSSSKMTSPANQPYDRVNLKCILCKGCSTMTLNSETTTENGGSDEAALSQSLENSMLPHWGRRAKSEAFSGLGARPPFSTGQDIIPCFSSPLFPKLHPTVLKLYVTYQ